jgi:pyridoxine 5'-phosphate synthase PdxJ
MTALSINLNKIALIRNSREGNYPNILDFANTCIDCGVDGITVHPRPDQRHIRPSDVRQLAQLVAPLDELNLILRAIHLLNPTVIIRVLLHWLRRLCLSSVHWYRIQIAN